MAKYYIRDGFVHVRGVVNGKQYRFSTRKEATHHNIRWVAKNVNEVLLKHVNDKSPKLSNNFLEYAQRSLDNNAYSRERLTVKDYQSMFNKHIKPYFANFDITEFKATYIKEWQNKLLYDKALSPKRVKNIRTVLSTIFNDAIMDELIEKNPLSIVKPPKQNNPEIHPLSLEEVQTLINKADGWFKHFITVAFFTGMRTGELLALRWDDVNFNSDTIYVRRSIRAGKIKSTKTGKERLIDMLPPVKDALKQMFKVNGLKYEYIFESKKGTPYTESGYLLKCRWKPLLKKCLIEYRTLYQTRHTFASIMLQQNEDVAWIASMLGHTTVATTLKYYAKYVKSNRAKRAEFLSDFNTKSA